MSLNKSKVLRTAEKYVLQGKIPAAIDEYRKVVDADPSDLTTINTLGDLYVRAGRIPDAIANFSRIADTYREGGFTLKAIAMLKKISKLDPTNIETSMKLANLYSQQGLLVEARQQYLQVADAYARAGQTRKALEAYQKIADLDPSNTSVRIKLAEIYSREKMPEQAHDAFIMAGAELLRKGDLDQALNANLKAIVVNPDSRQALTAIATIYTEQGQIDRAINILCEAFERNPGDIELLTILGRTYLSAGLMDDAERTFLSLVELDKNRYHYLLEVGRRFLQLGDVDRAAEQIDGCMEVLVSKREEDKAIDFLRRVLDRDMNHIGALRRLSQIFNRIREDHNLIATLNSLVEAAMKKGDETEAIAALKELARLEPDEGLHLQRLYNLGVRDIVEAGSPDVVRATGPLDYQSAAFDDTFVIRQISEAEILAGHGQVEHAVGMLREILNHAPENVQVHQKLKDIYLRAGLLEDAGAECLELSRIHQARGEAARASDFLAEARQINPLLEANLPASSAEAPADFGWGFSGAGEVSHMVSNDAARAADGAGSAEPRAEADWKRYETGKLDDGADAASFAGLPGVAQNFSEAGAPPSADSFGFSFADIVTDDDEAPGVESAKVAKPAFESPAFEAPAFESTTPEAPMFESSGFASQAPLPDEAPVSVHSDTVTAALREDLEGIDFYIAQGYADIARDALDRLRGSYGDHPEIAAREAQLQAQAGSSSAAWDEAVDEDLIPQPVFEPPAPPPQLEEPTIVEDGMDFFAFEQLDAAPTNGSGPVVAVSESVEPPDDGELGFEITAMEPSATERKSGSLKPFLIQKESGPLYPDVMVQLNTSDLLDNTAFDALRPLTGSLAISTVSPMRTDDLVDQLMSGIDEAGDDLSRVPFEDISEAAPIPGALSPETESVAELAVPHVDKSSLTAKPAGGFEAPVLEFEKPVEVRPAKDELQAIFDELKGETGNLKPLADFETHFSLGLAYKDMELMDEAVEEFQMAFRIAGLQGNDADYIHCCNMLGVCFQRKQMPRVALMWFQRGLKVPNRAEDEYQALRYEMGLCYEQLGEIDKAIDAFSEVYGIDVNYREVCGKLDQLQGAKSAC